MEYFRALTADREESAAVLEKTSMRGVQRSVVEKYSEQAHFVYELIQNADDAGATYARFVLENDYLLFAHNGTRQFTVSNPAREDRDTATGRLGDINAITSIANSNKTEASIGKFGVGFKAVFQYTATPHIYCPKIAFKIERFIVPQLLAEDHLNRREGETLFVFPFDRTDMRSFQAVRDISKRLRNLAYPVLFLNSLQRIAYTTSKGTGEYTKETIKKYQWNDVDIKLIRFTTTEGESVTDEKLWMLSRRGDSGYECSICYFLDEGEHLKPKVVPAYCYFPTTVNTGLNFMINAPFLLTDSREGIKYGDKHNLIMAKELGVLAGKSLMALRDIGEQIGRRIIDDNMFDVVPYQMRGSWRYNDSARFINALVEPVRTVLGCEAVFPSASGYWKASVSYLAENAPIAQLLNEDVLKELTDNNNARLILPSMPAISLDSKLISFLLKIGVKQITEMRLINMVSGPFVANQSAEWLSAYHGYLAESNRRTKLVRKRPVFVDATGAPCAAYDDHDKEMLFLPTDNPYDYRVLARESLEHEGTRKLVRLFRLQEPSLGDRIFSHVLPEFRKTRDARNPKAFLAIYNHYIDSDESASFIKKLSEYNFLAYRNNRGVGFGCAKADELYFPTDLLKRYFAHSDDVEFVDLDYYLSLVPDREKLVSFLSRLGVTDKPRLIGRTLNDQQAYSLERTTGVVWNQYTATRKHSWHEKDLDGLQNALDYLSENEDQDYSVVVWNILVLFVSGHCATKALASLLTGTFNYFYFQPRTQSYEPLSVYRLRHDRWVFDRVGNAVAPLGFVLDGLSERYDVSSKDAQTLSNFLRLEEPGVQEMSDGDKLAAALDETAKMFGSSFDELKDDPEINAAIQSVIVKALRERNALPSNVELVMSQDSLAGNQGVSDSRTRREATVHAVRPIDPASLGAAEEQKEVRGDPDINRFTGDLAVRAKEQRSERRRKETTVTRAGNTKVESINDDRVDSDEYTPAEVDFEQSSERVKNRFAREIDDLARKEALWNIAVKAEKYSFKWFKTLIELEQITDIGASSARNEIVISFGSVRLEEGTSRTLVLEQPSRNIPPSLEDLSNIPLHLDFETQTKSVEIEVASVRNYTLYVKLKDGAEITGIDLEKTLEARIEVRNPAFLLDELRKRLVGLAYKDSYNLRDELPDNIQFIFGPPGTGKTTYLANEVLLPFMARDEDLRVLVLAPTNKAADVLTRKIIECSNDADKCLSWLIRFGLTADDTLEEAGVHRDKTFDFSSLKRSVTVTTIARYPYDYYMTADGHENIRDMDWDYMVIDEASMISCAYIAYVLHKAKPRKFIIAGDPHQIAPVVKVSLWKDENIYTMTGLKSFSSPKTVPHNYEVVLLKKQYRSVPEIGSLFSKFAYGGMLTHDREASAAIRSCLGSLLGGTALNIIRFPVSRYESIYRPKYLRGGSSYQPYSALLTFELTRYLASQFAIEGKQASIGIVSPYKAQADLISGLLAQVALPSNVDVQVGTIHGFQGDECDVMIVVLNSPQKVSASKEMFLNKQNILNVSISRAKDCLILLVPDEKAPGKEKMVEINRLETICRDLGEVGEHESSSIEEAIFGNPTFILDNSFTTGHQMVNVYGRPEQRYEIRSEEYAVDIQVHDSVTTKR